MVRRIDLGVNLPANFHCLGLIICRSLNLINFPINFLTLRVINLFYNLTKVIVWRYYNFHYLSLIFHYLLRRSTLLYLNFIRTTQNDVYIIVLLRWLQFRGREIENISIYRWWKNIRAEFYIISSLYLGVVQWSERRLRQLL